MKRRHFITLGGAAAGAAFWGARPVRGQSSGDADLDDPRSSTLRRWRGAALGARAEIRLYAEDAAAARALLDACAREVDRLEDLFSLYRPHSALSRLNRRGHLDQPDIELVALLSRALACTRVTGGAFDVTIQPLWRLYADHFARDGADPAGPPPADIRATLTRVGSDKVRLDAGRISFARDGMGISLNGVAQGYITDRVSEILRGGGVDNFLVHMGETYARGRHDDGRPWTAGIASPLPDRKILKRIALDGQALATSGGYGSPFSDQSRLHHLLDPKSGRSADHHGAVSVIARDAATADMLSTALYVLPYQQVAEVWRHYPQLEKAIFVDHAGGITEFSG